MLAGVVLLVASLAPQEVAPRVVLSNPDVVAREELVRIPMPWPRGAVRDVAAVSVGERVAPCVPLVRWSDGSVAVAQIHMRVALGPREELVLPVEVADGASLDPFDAPFAMPVEMPLELRLVDPWGRTFTTGLESDPAAAVEPWAASPVSRIRRFRGVLTRAAGRNDVDVYFAVQAWLEEARGSDRATLTLVLDGDPRVGEVVLGPARFRSLALRVDDPTLRVHVRFRGELAIPEPTVGDDGRTEVVLVPPRDVHYLGDRTGRAFRLELVRVDDGDGPARAVDATPVVALPELAWVRATGAFGVHGGPAPVDAVGLANLRAAIRPWWVGRDAGPYGSFGPPRDPSVGGTFGLPPSALHDVLRGGGALHLALAEVAVLQHTLRPTPGSRPRLPDATETLRAGLSPAAIARPHGYASYDYEHFSVDLLYDLHWLTGDPLARHELARAGSGLLAVLRSVPFRTSRGEGACLRAGVAIARATGERELLDALLVHVREVVIPAIGGDEPNRAHAIAQPARNDALGPDHPFDVPWQMGLLVHGLHALWSETGDDAVRTVGVRVARRMAGPCWIDGVGLASFVSAADPNVRADPIGGLRGACGVAIGAFALAAEMAGSADDRSRFLARADEVIRSARSQPGAGTVPDRWLQLLLDRNARVR